MSDVFNGWKRKIGAVTLMTACLCMAAWIRGFAIEDVIRFGNGQGIITKGRVLQTLSTSSKNGLVWTREETDCDITWVAGWQSHPTEESRAFDPKENVIDTGVMDWRWKFLGFDVGKFHGDPSDSLWFCQISHWSIVIPLTLISGSLLLFKPRLRKMAESPQRII